MARRKKEEAEGATEQAKPSEVRKMPGKGAYDTIIRAICTAKQDVSDIGGTLSGQITAFVEKWGFSRKAIRLLAECEKMENEKLHDFLECFDHGREVRGLNERAASVQPMQFSGDGSEDDESAGAEQGHRRNVRPFPAPGSVAAE